MFVAQIGIKTFLSTSNLCKRMESLLNFKLPIIRTLTLYGALTASYSDKRTQTYRYLIVAIYFGISSSHSLSQPFFPPRISRREIHLRNAHPFIYLLYSPTETTASFRGLAALPAVSPIVFSAADIFPAGVFIGRGKNALTAVIHRASTSSNTPVVTYAGWPVIVKVTRRVTRANPLCALLLRRSE